MSLNEVVWYLKNTQPPQIHISRNLLPLTIFDLDYSYKEDEKIAYVYLTQTQITFIVVK